MRREYRLFIQDILRAINDIDQFIRDTDFEIVWDVVKKKLPKIKPLIENVLTEQEGKKNA